MKNKALLKAVNRVKVVKVPKPYPTRLQLGERVFKIITEAAKEERKRRWPSVKHLAGNATDRIIKIVQNNYRRRRKEN